jgi:hypothetical protein
MARLPAHELVRVSLSNWRGASDARGGQSAPGLAAEDYPEEFSASFTAAGRTHNLQLQRNRHLFGVGYRRFRWGVEAAGPRRAAWRLGISAALTMWHSLVQGRRARARRGGGRRGRRLQLPLPGARGGRAHCHASRGCLHVRRRSVGACDPRRGAIHHSPRCAARWARRTVRRARRQDVTGAHAVELETGATLMNVASGAQHLLYRSRDAPDAPAFGCGVDHEDDSGDGHAHSHEHAAPITPLTAASGQAR